MLGQRTGLTEHEDTFTKRHDRGNRLDLERRGDSLLRFGIDLGERDVSVIARHLVVDGRKHLARTAPIGPEVDQCDAVADDR